MPAFHSRRAMVLMLAPPTLWALHFLACYLIVSLACAHGAGQGTVRTGIALASVAGLARENQLPSTISASSRPRPSTR